MYLLIGRDGKMENKNCCVQKAKIGGRISRGLIISVPKFLQQTPREEELHLWGVYLQGHNILCTEISYLWEMFLENTYYLEMFDTVFLNLIHFAATLFFCVYSVWNLMRKFWSKSALSEHTLKHDVTSRKKPSLIIWLGKRGSPTPVTAMPQ